MHDEKSLLKLRVDTLSGTHLGKVSGFRFEDGTQMIVQYKVRPKGLAAGIVKTPLIIAREQVIRVEDDRMIVEDAVAKERETEAARAIGLVENRPS